MVLPKRKQNRLESYDYSTPGYYYLTICTQDKEKFLWDSEKLLEGKPVLSSAGLVVEKAIRDIPAHYPSVRVDLYTVMPNHIHLILQLMEGEASPGCPSVSTVIGQMKRVVSKTLQRSAWQKGFHDHAIRGEADYREIWEYIADNPRKWTEDDFYLP